VARAVPLPRVLAAVLLAGLVPCQVPVGHAVLVTDATTTAATLWSYEPLHGTFAPLDRSALPPTFRLSAANLARDGQNLLLTGAPGGNVDDVVLATSVQGSRLQAPATFAQGLAGRAIALFHVPATAQIVVVTDRAVFGIPSNGGAARPLTPLATRMDNLAAVFVAPDTVITSAVDANGQALLWQLEVTSQRLTTIPLRVAGRMVLAPGPTVNTILLGEASGQLWVTNLSSLTRTPLVHLGRPGLRALWHHDDQGGWIAAVGADLQRIGPQGLGPSTPVPGGATALDVAYRPYGSAVAAYGTGCNGSNGRPPAIGWQGRPVPGNRGFALTLADARPGSAAALVLGVGPTNVALDFLGMPGCVMLTSPLVSIAGSTTAVGTAQVPLAVPPDPWLAGARFFAQWVVIDPGANRASLVTADAARAEI